MGMVWCTDTAPLSRTECSTFFSGRWKAFQNLWSFVSYIFEAQDYNHFIHSIKIKQNTKVSPAMQHNQKPIKYVKSFLVKICTRHKFVSRKYLNIIIAWKNEKIRAFSADC